MITDEQAQEAKEQLVFFLTDSKETLFSLLPQMERYIDWEFWAGESFRELMAAWNEFEEMWEENWPQFKTRIYETSKQAIEEAGLYGKQLFAKINIYKRLKGKLSEKIDMAKPHFKRIFTALIAAINNTLQSITEATGIGEALREMKDLMQNLMA